MLVTASTPWYLSSPVGEVVLLFAISIGSFIRKWISPSAIHNGMVAKGLDKIRLLDTYHPAIGGVCFVGSSTFTYWRYIEADFQELGVPVINAGFGGSCTNDILPLMDRLCTQFKPRVVVYFCGTNNLTQGMPVSTVLDDFKSFATRLFESNPSTHIVYLGLTTTPFCLKWNINNFLVTARKANELLQEYCLSQPESLTYVHTDDLNKTPWIRDPAMYLGDGHHLTDEGHQRLAREVLIPAIKRIIT